MKILIKRNGALGDVILCLPVVQWLRKVHGESLEIDFLCAPRCGEIFRNHPYVNAISMETGRRYDQSFDLNLAYEKNPLIHIVVAYAKACGFYPTEFEQPHVYFKDEITFSADVVIHAAKTWENRTWPHEKWQEVAERIGGSVAFIGSQDDFGFSDEGEITDLRGVLTLGEIHSVIANAKCFIGSDSGLMHLATTTKTPIVGLFTSARAAFRSPWRFPESFAAVQSPVDCYGCLHTMPAPVVHCSCPQNRNYECIQKITPEMVLQAHNELMRQK